MLTPSPLRSPIRRRTRRDPKPRFKPDVSGQLDAVLGCPAVGLPKDHLARMVRELLAELDLSSVESKYSSLGRRGFEPRHVLGALIYGSLIRIHHSTKLARAMVSDAALRLVAGGHAISEGALRRFRRDNLALYEQVRLQVLKLAHEAGLIDPDEISLDSVRMEAHASTEAVMTLTRSETRLEELAKVDVAALSPEELMKHQEKVSRHLEAVEECRKLGRTNLVRTSPSAGLLKFPNGASKPGHRVTVVATGSTARFVLDLFVDAAPNDYGKLQGAAERTRAALKNAGVDVIGPLQLSADAGYFSEADVVFAAASEEWVNVLMRERPEHALKSKSGEKLYTRANFTLAEDGTATCPAGTKMHGPVKDGAERIAWKGVGCPDCPLKSRCTEKPTRHLSVKPSFEAARGALRKRMAAPGAEEKYNQRIATVEPVFSVIEDTMGFRRVSSRHEESVRAEIELKFLAYNIGRLIAARRLRRVRVMIIWAVA